MKLKYVKRHKVQRYSLGIEDNNNNNINLSSISIFLAISIHFSASFLKIGCNSHENVIKGSLKIDLGIEKEERSGQI